MFCEKCGNEIVETETFCKNCGEMIKKTNCLNCGTEAKSNSEFCSNCGHQLKQSIDKVMPKSMMDIVQNKELFKMLVIGLNVFALILLLLTPLYGIYINGNHPHQIGLFSLGEDIGTWIINVPKVASPGFLSPYTYYVEARADFAIFLGNIINFVLNISVLFIIIATFIFVKFKIMLIQMVSTVLFIIPSISLILVRNNMTGESGSFTPEISLFLIIGLFIISTIFMKYYLQKSFKDNLISDYKTVMSKVLRFKEKTKNKF